MKDLSRTLLIIALGALVALSAMVFDAAAQDDGVHGWVEIFTNYEAAVTVDGKPYPRRAEHGMKVSAGERHKVKVKLGEKEKNYTIVVGKGEKRTLMVDLTGYQTPPAPATKGSIKNNKSKESNPTDDDGETGKLTVYSKPKGEVHVDGSSLGVSTPMINRDLEVGRHEVQVKWESGQMSEVKTIRIRKGSKLKLFFRDRNKKLGGK